MLYFIQIYPSDLTQQVFKLKREQFGQEGTAISDPKA